MKKSLKSQYLCTICARGGSKGLPGKNIKPLLGKPLIAHTVERALETGLFSHVAVSSDCLEILNAAKSAGADLIIERPKEMASDNAGKIPAIHHALCMAEKMTGKTFDIQVDLDTTSPLRWVEDILGAIELQEETKCSNVITGSVAHNSPYFSLVEMNADGFVDLAIRKDDEVLRRQDAPKCYDMNGSIYVWNRDIFHQDPQLFYDDTRLYEMPTSRSRDIDEALDFFLVEKMMQYNIENS